MAVNQTCDDLLSFATTGVHGPSQFVDLNHAVAQAMQNLEPPLRASGAVVTVARMPIVHSNEIHLIRHFQNLISNSMKYRAEDPVEIHVSAERHGADWVTKIADNGLGLALENQTRVFMSFIGLASRDVLGTGLDLAVCKKVVEGLGGTIWVESELAAGSTFCFTIEAPGKGL